MKQFTVKKVTIGQGAPLAIIAGPCVIESRDMVLGIAEELKELCARFNVSYIFKASYRKANRTSIDSFTGPGIEEGLRILDEVRHQFDVPVLTDVHLPEEVAAAAQVADIIQIPAFLSRQTELLLAAGESGKVVNVKKGQFLAPADMANVAAKVASTGNDKILLTERGVSFGYNNLVVDFRAFMDMHKIGYPVVYDATHSLQRPSAGGQVSGGQPEYVPRMAAAAVATQTLSALFIETHPEPLKALSDAQSMLPLAEMEGLLRTVTKIERALG